MKSKTGTQNRQLQGAQSALPCKSITSKGPQKTVVPTALAFFTADSVNRALEPKLTVTRRRGRAYTFASAALMALHPRLGLFPQNRQ